MDAMSSPVDDVRPRGRWLVWALLVVLAATAVRTVDVMVWAAGGWERSSTGGSAVPTVLFTAWNLAPIAAMAVVVLRTHRRWPRAVLLTVAAGVVVLVAPTAWAFSGSKTDESSTAALLFLVLPLYQWLGVGLTVCAGVGVRALRSRLRRTRTVTAA